MSSISGRISGMTAMASAVPMLALALALTLAGCGQRTDLRPKVGHQLPIPPYGRPDRPSPRELLTASSLARPGNSVELRIVSEPRSDDPFDLPPKNQ